MTSPSPPFRREVWPEDQGPRSEWQGYGPRPQPEDVAQTFDVCIVGSGAAGSVAADLLVSVGARVLVLEQGPYLPRDASYDQVVMDAEMALGRTESGTWSLIGYPWTTCNVGGGTVFYGAASFRYREADFRARELMPEADLEIDWPFDYGTLRPHYEAVERRIGVSAAPSLDPTCPGGTATHYLPAVPRSRGGQFIWDAARRLGLSPFPTPLAILTEDWGSRRACRFDNPCIEFPCTVGAKGDSRTVYLNSLFASPHFRLFAGMAAIKLVRRRRRSVDEVEALDVVTGEVLRFRARSFIVAANAVQTAALLLRSGDSFEPDGLGNSNGLVGRGLSFKVNGHVAGYRSEAKDIAAPNGGPFSTVSVMDHYFDPDCPGKLGGLIYEGGYGFSYRTAPGDDFLRLEVLLADQPSYDNRVLLASKRDTLGLPRIALLYNTHPRDRARLNFMLDRAEDILRTAGCTQIWREAEAFQLGSCHLHGTCRAAVDPSRGVVDATGRLHDVENVYVADGAFMPFPSGLNPTLTIQALAHRVASILSGTLR